MALKISPALSHSDLVAFDILAKQGTISDDLQPIVKVEKLATGYKFSFNRKRAFMGINIYRKRPGAEKSAPILCIGRFYIDEEPMVEGTEYFFWFLDKKGKETGKEANYKVTL